VCLCVCVRWNRQRRLLFSAVPRGHAWQRILRRLLPRPGNVGDQPQRQRSTDLGAQFAASLLRLRPYHQRSVFLHDAVFMYHHHYRHHQSTGVILLLSIRLQTGPRSTVASVPIIFFDLIVYILRNIYFIFLK